MIVFGPLFGTVAGFIIGSLAIPPDPSIFLVLRLFQRPEATNRPES